MFGLCSSCTASLLVTNFGCNFLCNHLQGIANSAVELEAALKLYSQMVASESAGHLALIACHLVWIKLMPRQ
jgi:hypothetical protein